jgi:hypothetical protein
MKELKRLVDYMCMHTLYLPTFLSTNGFQGVSKQNPRVFTITCMLHLTLFSKEKINAMVYNPKVLVLKFFLNFFSSTNKMDENKFPFDNFLKLVA